MVMFPKLSQRRPSKRFIGYVGLDILVSVKMHLPALGTRRVIKVWVGWTPWACQVVIKPKKLRFSEDGISGFLVMKYSRLGGA